MILSPSRRPGWRRFCCSESVMGYSWGGVVVLGGALLLSACSSTVTSNTGPGGTSSGGGDTGANHSGANSTGANNTGGSSTGASGGSVPVDCVTAQNFDPCSSPGS